MPSSELLQDSANSRASDDDVLRHTVTVDYSGHPYVTRYQPTIEDLARRE